jgi:hypothetical protein
MPVVNPSTKPLSTRQRIMLEAGITPPELEANARVSVLPTGDVSKVDGYPSVTVTEVDSQLDKSGEGLPTVAPVTERTYRFVAYRDDDSRTPNGERTRPASEADRSHGRVATSLNFGGQR